jgi:hypothetical protein
MSANKLDPQVLGQFTGSEHWYRHSLIPMIRYTEGIKYVADNARAYWLLDEIASFQLEKKIRDEEFQVWKLEVANESGRLICEDGNDNVVFTTKPFFTDFPAPGITLWYTDHTILLPGEY